MITQITIERYLQLTKDLPQSDTEPVKCWAAENEKFLGVVLKDRWDHDWSWVVLERDTRGSYSGIALDTCLAQQEHAAAQVQVILKQHERKPTNQ